MSHSKEEQWDIVIKPEGRRFSLNLSEVWRYRDLLMMYIRRDIVVVYKQTILGPLWFIIQPVFTTVMFMFVFGGIAGISTDGLPQPLFYMAGILCWNYFSECLTRSSSTFMTNAGVFSKVYFPRLVVPFSVAVSNLFKFFIQFFLFISLYIYFVVDGAAVGVNTYALLFPLLILMLGSLGLGFGIIISSLTNKYRDLAILFTFAVQLWMYITPVIYPLSVMKERYAEWMWVVQMNPLTSIIEAFKYGFLGTGTFTWFSLLYSFAFSVIILIIGSWVFNKVERKFVDVV
ncbi:ABC transporter permease [Dysgonomonas sp. 216]|uniref:ABC transporter permease n=1 Tax=Dysgonomonas sp. 216 TaxID=2302934 RepID=UPI0013D23825|nr:ABC transporter permease [Dysgonomonas sp. 216]NDW17548.1 ABC transporter permease [Dysgonomonas sp. 216]